MTPRPRKATDEEVFAATARVMSRVGPGELSLTEIAAEAGLTAGALVQRFGSKRELLLAVVATWAEGTRAMLDEVRGSQASALGSVRAYARCMAGLGETPAGLAHHLSYLQLDLTDPEFRTHMRDNAELTRATLAEWLDEAKAAGELAEGVDTASLARLLEALVSGSLLSWAVYQEGRAEAWLARDVDDLLKAFGA